jgi:hypothetical protein
MCWLPSQRLIVALIFCRLGPTNCWRFPSLASSLRSFTNFKWPSLTLQFCSFYSIIYMFTFLVDLSPQCSWSLWLEAFPSKFQGAFHHAGRESDYSYSTIHKWWWVVNNTSRPLYPWERVPAPIVEEAGWGPESVCMAWGWEKFATTGVRKPNSPDRGDSL